MMADHDEIRTLLIDFIASRLEGEKLRLVETHLAGCKECGEMVSDLKGMMREIQRGGEAMFEPHPDPATLRRMGRGEETGIDPRVHRHLELCPTCRLEAETWKRMREVGGTASSALPPFSPAPSPLWIGLAAAAGVVLGCLVTLRLVPSLTQRTGPPIPSTQPRPGVLLSPSMRQPVIHFLPNLLRDGETPSQPWSLEPEEPFISVAVPLTLPSTTADEERFRFELRKAGQEPVLSVEMTASQIRKHLEASEVVNLAMVAPRTLEAGSYEFRVVASDSPDAQPLYRAQIELSYRQSPAATKAPQ